LEKQPQILRRFAPQDDSRIALLANYHRTGDFEAAANEEQLRLLRRFAPLDDSLKG
jgi:hypothetical protein